MLNKDNQQYYKTIDRSNPETIEKAGIKDGIVVYRQDSSPGNHYVSDVKIKPKELHYVETRIQEAYKVMGVSEKDNRPSIYILDSTQTSNSAIASYEAARNRIYVYKKGGIIDKSYYDGLNDKAKIKLDLLQMKG